MVRSIPKWMIVVVSLVVGLVSSAISVKRALEGACACVDCFGVIALAVIIPILFCLGPEDSGDSTQRKIY